MAEWSKQFSRVNWENLPSHRTPLDQLNLNRGDNALNVIDDRVIELKTTKAEQSDLLTCVSNVLYNRDNGVLTIVFKNGTTVSHDTLLEKIAVNFDYVDDPQSQHFRNIKITLDDGTVKYIDLSSMVTDWEFYGTGPIDVNTNTPIVTTSIKANSITEDYISPNYTAKLRTMENNAESAATSAQSSATVSTTQAQLSESYAVGNDTYRQGSSTDNALYYKNQCASMKQDVQAMQASVQTLATTVSTDKAIVQSERQLAEQASLNASTSETNASTSETNAHTSEVNAHNSETNASTSEANAHTYMQQTQTLYNDLDSRLVNEIASKIADMSFAVNSSGHLIMTINGTE